MEYSKNQLKAINHYKGNCSVLASAGSGKTSVLINRIVNLINNHSIEPSKILALTFSKKAVLNMINKLDGFIPDNNVSILTFHALGYNILKENGYYYEIIKEWEKIKLINNICMNILSLGENEIDIPTSDILNFIAYQKNQLIKPINKFTYLNKFPYNEEIMRNIYTLYEKHKDKIDFEDMLLKSYEILSNNKYITPYEFILVDEFQDTNKAQYEIIKLLNKNNNLFVVGDPLQNIYEWRGSNNKYLIDFYKDWCKSKVIPLNINYRSTNNIVVFSNNLMKNTIETNHKHYVESIADKNKYKNPIINIYINEVEESIGICNTIKGLIENNYNYKDIAILTRTNFQMQAIERSLYSNDIPYSIVDGNKFYELKEIKDILSYLRLIKDTSNDEAFLNIYNTPNRYLGNVFITEIKLYAKKYRLSLFDSMQEFPRSNEWRYKKGIKDFSKLINSLKNRKRYTVGKLIKTIREKLNYDKYILKENHENNNRNKKIENLDALMNLADKYNDIGLFLDEIDNMLEPNKDNNNISLMTIHKSKGLEFPVVFVAGVSNGLLPHKKSNNINEEKRLLYVAATRAEKELYISSVETYYNKNLGVSNFLVGL